MPAYAVWKTPLPLVLSPAAMLDHTVTLPMGARPLSVDTEPGPTHEVPVLWWLVEPNAQPTTYRVALALTGQPLPTGAHEWTPIGTLRIGPYVLHAFLRG